VNCPGRKLSIKMGADFRTLHLPDHLAISGNNIEGWNGYPVLFMAKVVPI
jgi:hypothetical protein